MTQIKGHEYTWNKSWIEFKAPDAPGVYCLRDREGKLLFIGKGKVRERPLSHWNQENSTDEALWDHAPVTFQFELVAHPAEREAEFIQEGAERPPVFGVRGNDHPDSRRPEQWRSALDATELNGAGKAGRSYWQRHVARFCLTFVA